MKYSVDLGYYVSQNIEVEADDVDQAIELAFTKGPDHPNVSNKFEQAGDDVCFGVYDEQGNQVYEGDL